MSIPYNLSMALLHVQAELDRRPVSMKTNEPLEEIYVDLARVFERLTDASAKELNEEPILQLVVSHKGRN